MNALRQKLIFKGPMAESLYKALEKYIKETTPTTESIEDQESAVSIVSDEQGKQIVIKQDKRITTILVYGIGPVQTNAQFIAEFVNYLTHVKPSTKVKLLIIDDRDAQEPSEFFPQLITLASKLDIEVYTSFDTLVKELVG